MTKMKVALQLFSIKEEIERDMNNAFENVNTMGYDYVELPAGYFEKTANEVKGLLDKYGLQCISVHQRHDIFLDNPNEAICNLQKVGAKFCVVPWLGKENHKGTESFGKTVEQLKKIGALLNEVGITFLYHNHWFEFEKYEDKCLLDWLYETIPSDLMKTEFDTCWVRYSGYEPAEYLRKYSGRSPIVHLKDFTYEGLEKDEVYAFLDKSREDGQETKNKSKGFIFRPLGMGVLDIPEILRAANVAGSEYIVVEQDKSTDIPALESAKISREYLFKLGF